MTVLEMTPPTLDSETETPALVVGCLESLARCSALVDRVGEQGYCARPKGHSSIGQHMRHCLDHYQSFLRGYRNGVVDYEHRDRGGRIEEDPQVFYSTLEGIVDALHQVSFDDMDWPLEIVQRASADEDPVACQSTVARELSFLSGHTIHHLGTMVLLAQLAGCPVSPDLGMAFSTLTARKKGQ